MNSLILKYQSKLSILIFTVYLFLLIAGIFHYHNFNFSNRAFVDSRKDNFSNHIQAATGNNYNCIIQQNVTNLQTALVTVFDNNQLLIETNIFNQNADHHFDINQIHLTDNPLRAPPLNS